MLCVFLLALPKRLRKILGRLDIGAGIIAVDDGFPSVPVFVHVLALHQGRNAHGTRKYRCVTVERSLFGDDAEEKRLIEAHGLGGCKVPGCQNTGLRTLQRIRIDAEEIVQHRLLDVVDIRRSLPHVRIIHFRKNLGLIVEGHLDRILRRVLLRLDDFVGCIQKIVVLKHHRMDGEHLRAVLTGIDQRLFVERILLFDGALSGVVETLQFGLDILNQSVADFELRRLINYNFSDGNPV